MKLKTLLVLLCGVALWWVAAAPPAHHSVPEAIVFTDEATRAAAATDHSPDFARALEVLDVDIPGHDDIVFLDQGRRWLLSAMDGRIWSYDPQTRKAEPFVDPPLMAAGLHESPVDADAVYFCASRLWGQRYPDGERVGLYRLKVSTRKIEPVVLDVPATTIAGPKVWPLDDPDAPALAAGQSGAAARPLAFCNDLEISADGMRIYFSEPFADAGASMGGGTIAEALALQGNGRIWMHDLGSGRTRLVAEGIHFPDGLLLDLHPGEAQERSILTSLTTGFQIARVHLRGPAAGRFEVLHAGLPGMCDGMDRDGAGRIWCAMYTRRSPLMTWLHGHPWAKQVLLRLPLNWIPQPKATGVMVFSPDASKVVYSAWYEGDKLTHNASVLAAPDGHVYFAPFSRDHRGLVRMKNPLAGPESQAAQLGAQAAASARVRRAGYRGQGPVLSFLPHHGTAQAPLAPQDAGYAHLCFEADDVAAVLQSIQAHGGHDGNRMLFSTSP